MNQFRVSKAEFRKAIKTTKLALPKVILLEERGHLLFEVRGSVLCVRGTNSDLKAKAVVEIENEGGDFSFTSDPKILDKLLSKIDIETVTVQFSQDDYSVRIHTDESKKSQSAIQSLYPDKMLTFPDNEMERKEYKVNRHTLSFALKYLNSFLAPLKEDQKQYDYVVIDQGFSFAANGSNKMGFVIFKCFAHLEEYKIRKLVLPMFRSFLNEVGEDEIVLFETDRDFGIETVDGNKHFSYLKSNNPSPVIPKENAVSKGAYILVDKKELQKSLERLRISHVSPLGAGIKFTVKGEGEEGVLESTLLSNEKSVETVPCTRIDNGDAEEIERIILFDLFKAVLWSFNSENQIKLHINDLDNSKFFKVYDSGEVDGEKYVLVGIGTYARILKGN